MRYKLLSALVLISCAVHGQQVNPVPDYVFANRMSVGRNAVTDTLAYFSIGPRYGAIRGFMPPMVVDTALVTGGTKRNGLTIFSIQKNKYLYWDSVRVQWSDFAGSSGAYIFATDTASMLSPYIRAAGYGLTKSSQSLLVDTAAMATRARVKKQIDSIASIELSISDTSSMLSPYTRGSGTTNYLPKFTGTRTFGNSQIFDNGTNVGIGTTSPTRKFHVVGDVNINGHTAGRGAGDISSNVTFGSQALFGNTTGNENVAIGDRAMFTNSTGSGNVAMGIIAMYFNTTGSANVAIGGDALSKITTGSSNTALGVSAGTSINSGSANQTSNNSIYLGRDARPSADGNTNEVVIGYQGRGNGSNTTTIGNGSTTTTIIPAGETLLNTSTDAGAYALQVAGETYGTGAATMSAFIPTGSSVPTNGMFLIASNRVAFAANSTTRMVIHENGQVGVGTTPSGWITGVPAVLAIGTYGALWHSGGYTGLSNNAYYGTLGWTYNSSTQATKLEQVIGEYRFNVAAYGTAGSAITWTQAMTLTNNSELLLNTTTDAGAYALQVTGAIYNTTTLTTGAPTSGTAKPWRLGEAATVSPTSPNRTIRVEIDGTVYYIHAKTTND